MRLYEAKNRNIYDVNKRKKSKKISIGLRIIV